MDWGLDQLDERRQRLAAAWLSMKGCAPDGAERCTASNVGVAQGHS